MTRNTDANCGNCPFGKENSLDPLTVDCHRYPPVHTAEATRDDGEYSEFSFPAFRRDGWCGEHPDFFNRGEAQVEEPRTHNSHDAGSSPATSSTFDTHTHGVTSHGPAAGADGSTLPFVGPGATQNACPHDATIDSNSKTRVVAYVLREGGEILKREPFDDISHAIALVTRHGRIFDCGCGYRAGVIARDIRAKLREWQWI